MAKGKKIEVTEHGRSTAYSKKVQLTVASEVPTHSLVWIMLKRHWKGMSIAGNVILALNFIFPQWFVFVKSLLS